mmetsp:Transcript_9447/g.25636  ORF Transcript_9447/g.25636 Transcript_9447/m.25636 type:complete len:206 (-) Transcript_9447:1050-1667(-)
MICVNLSFHEWLPTEYGTPNDRMSGNTSFCSPECIPLTVRCTDSSSSSLTRVESPASLALAAFCFSLALPALSAPRTLSSSPRTPGTSADALAERPFLDTFPTLACSGASFALRFPGPAISAPAAPAAPAATTPNVPGDVRAGSSFISPVPSSFVLSPELAPLTPPLPLHCGFWNSSSSIASNPPNWSIGPSSSSSVGSPHVTVS